MLASTATSGSPEPPKRIHAEEVHVDGDAVRGLINARLPLWASLALPRTPSAGTESATHRLGRHLGVGVPRVRRALRRGGRPQERRAGG